MIKNTIKFFSKSNLCCAHYCFPSRSASIVATKLPPSDVMKRVPVKESQEALEHVLHVGKKIDFDPAAMLAEEKIVDPRRLNRNKGLARKLNYRVVGEVDLPKVHAMLYQSFHPDEPIIKYLRICKGLNSIPDADRIVEDILAKNLSVIAEDEGGKTIALSINNSCYGSELTPQRHASELGTVKDERFRHYVAIHQQLRLQNRHAYKEMGTDKLFSVRMVAVSGCSRGQGLATDIIRRSVLLAGCLGFHGIKTEATGRWSKSAFGKIGLLPYGSIKYEDFEYEGERVFQGLTEDTEITYMRKKFFQSALKHIL